MPSADQTRPNSLSNGNDSQPVVNTQAATPSDGFLSRTWGVYVVVILFAAAVYLGTILSPPSLQDDVDAVQAQIARNMLTSGDWVTARLDGVIYLEKAPLIYWLIAIS